MTLTLTSDLVSGNLHRIWCISPIFCEVGIPNLVFGCILGVAECCPPFWVTVTLTYDLISRIIVS